MEGIKYVNLIKIGAVVIEIRGAKNGELTVPVNNRLVSQMAFLAADKRPCVLIYICIYTVGPRLSEHLCATSIVKVFR